MKLKQILSYLLFTLIIGLTFTACDSDDADSPVVSEWEFTGFNFNVETTDPSLKQSILDLLKNFRHHLSELIPLEKMAPVRAV